MIAARNDKGDILWSWHVWVTDYHPDATGDASVDEPETKRKQKYTYGNHPNQYPIMDRNLGALAGYTTIPAEEEDSRRHMVSIINGVERTLSPVVILQSTCPK